MSKQATPIGWELALLNYALAINDALRFHDDYVEYTGSMNLAEEFREVVNQAWHSHSETLRS
jgi:hypothetical protein